MAERGVIRNREFAQQIRDFSGLRFGTITPTDIDGFIDYQDKLFVFFESKYGDTKLPYGQKLALERLCDACASAGKLSAVLLLRHDSIIPGSDIEFAKLKVTSYRLNKEWHTPRVGIDCRAALEKLLRSSRLEQVKPTIVATEVAIKREQFETDFDYLVRSEPAPW